MIFEDSAKWFVHKYLNPCKTCLVQVTCDPTSLRGKCDLYNKFLKRLGQGDTWGSNADVWTFLILAGAFRRYQLRPPAMTNTNTKTT